jgi:hypothetical protein
MLRRPAGQGIDQLLASGQIEVGDHYCGTVAGQPMGDGDTEAPGAAGEQDDGSGEAVG